MVAVAALQLGVAIELGLAVCVGGTQAYVYDTAHHPPVAGAEISRIEVDVIEQLGRDCTAQAAEVIDQRDQIAVHEHGRVFRRRAAYDQEPGESWRACQTG